jgi:hypothetical protein
MTIEDLLSDPWNDLASLTTLGPLIRANGVDLCADDLSSRVDRGTPLYVRAANADPVVVQRRMALVHAKLVFVLDTDNKLIGVIDFWNLATRSEELAWLARSLDPTS